MSEPLVKVAESSIVDQFLNKSLDYLGSAEAFLKAEVPSFIQEFMSWKMYESSFGLTVCLIGIIVSILLSIYFFKKTLKFEDYDAAFFCKIMVFVSGTLTSILLISAISYTKDIIKLKVAPRVYLLEQIKHITK